MKAAIALWCLCFPVILHAQTAPLYKELFRPQFHFTSEKNWINDPNGLVYYDGEYHLFYQHNPFGNVWGHMSWGHAVSTDLVHWKHLPVALPEENGIMIFSGCVVVDQTNSSGFGKNGQVPMVAIYTGDIPHTNQSQYLAYSLDKGRTWTKYSGNPVLDLKKKDFRDPKVFWYAPHQKWVMAVALPLERQVQFYSSKNLKAWDLMSSFGPAGDTSGIWECPDLFEVPVKNQPGKTKWVQMHSPAPYMQYFVGDFDGTVFRNESIPGKIYRPDYGPDYYAAIVFNNLPSAAAPVSIGWINNWNYANEIPTHPWKGAMSLPRALSVKKIGDEWILFQEPVKQLELLRTTWMEGKKLRVETRTELFRSAGPFELQLQFMPGAQSKAGIYLNSGSKNETIIGFDAMKKELFIDRSRSDTFSNSEYKKLSRFSVPLETINGIIQLRVFYDQSIVEVFANHGAACFTFQVFPDNPYNIISLFSQNGAMEVSDVTFWSMGSVWKNPGN
jgi:fructan beta-fructosidase